MSNLMGIQLQIEKLQKQAAEIKAKEFDKTLREILEKMQAFGITVKDLQAAKPRKRNAVSVPVKKSTASAGKKTKGATVAPKYRGPEGQTWTGRGLKPRWMSILIDQGRQKEEFAITA